MNPYDKSPAVKQPESKPASRADAERVAGPATDRRITLERALPRVLSQLTMQRAGGNYMQYPAYQAPGEYGYGAQANFDHLVGQAAASDIVTAPADNDANFLADLMPDARADPSLIGTDITEERRQVMENAAIVAEAEAITRQAAAERQAQLGTADWNRMQEATMAGPQMPQNVDYVRHMEDTDVDAQQRQMVDARQKIANIWPQPEPVVPVSQNPNDYELAA